ncbi:hypothetical protein HYPSUDRAFT_148524 [Hypholoma sublateritium FD-334 SS-4]|uniref:DUF4419 domain-containing protein n=1 Tax=Hypholoma sublateritium (strain FD-334 SS-4) TaxID=945553 RepID=A0A0D2LYE5_HYPSF|nr:hypothetical protein HYPSUDRAFT_148524 [Hypholoma sublateritium FD-334 SS-4]
MRGAPIFTTTDLLSRTWGAKAKASRCAEMLQSSLHSSETEDLLRMHPQVNGFVDTFLVAYNQHHHITIRPDDIWMAILSQFNLYVNAHAEELRSHFVQHVGRRHLIVRAAGTRYTVDFGSLAEQMTGLIDEHLSDKELKSWILPDFTTTTHNDTVICAVYMMSTLKAYFTYEMELRCGIPSVTLEGEKSDWESLLSRIDKLKGFGLEPEAWTTLLRPILTRFVQAFDGQPDIDFWGRVCHHHEQMSGPSYLSGWITAFCVWNKNGQWQGPSLKVPKGPQVVGQVKDEKLVLDGVQYGMVNIKNVAPGFCEVDVVLDDNGEIFDCTMVSGLCATAVEGEREDAVRPLSAWFMFIKETREKPGNYY